MSDITCLHFVGVIAWLVVDSGRMTGFSGVLSDPLLKAFVFPCYYLQWTTGDLPLLPNMYKLLLCGERTTLIWSKPHSIGGGRQHFMPSMVTTYVVSPALQRA